MLTIEESYKKPPAQDQIIITVFEVLHYKKCESVHFLNIRVKRVNFSNIAESNLSVGPSVFVDIFSLFTVDNQP